MSVEFLELPVPLNFEQLPNQKKKKNKNLKKKNYFNLKILF